MVATLTRTAWTDALGRARDEQIRVWQTPTGWRASSGSHPGRSYPLTVEGNVVTRCGCQSTVETCKHAAAFYAQIGVEARAEETLTVASVQEKYREILSITPEESDQITTEVVLRWINNFDDGGDARRLFILEVNAEPVAYVTEFRDEPRAVAFSLDGQPISTAASSRDEAVVDVLNAYMKLLAREIDSILGMFLFKMHGISRAVYDEQSGGVLDRASLVHAAFEVLEKRRAR